MVDEVLGYTADDAPIGDRIAGSGWPRLSGVRLMKADASGTIVFASVGAVAHGPAHTKTTIVLSGDEIEGTPVVLDDDYLVGEGPVIGVVESRRVVLDDFIRLAGDPTDAAILAYAREYSLLGLVPRPRQRPGMDPIPPWVAWVGELIVPSIGYRHAPGVASESLRLWRRVLGEMAAVYVIAGRLRRDEIVARTAWEPLRAIVRLPLSSGQDVVDSESDPDPLEQSVPWLLVSPGTLEGQRQALAAIIGTWLAVGAVRPMVSWGGPSQDAPLIALGTSTLFGGLILELLLAVGGQPGFAICSGCGQPFVPTRRPPSGAYGAPRKTYCAACRAPSADRRTPLPQIEASRRWRTRHPDYKRKPRAGPRTHNVQS